jgi:acyl-CoA dehydrogenase
MAWDFQTDANYQRLLDWVDQFVREEVEHAVGNS